MFLGKLPATRRYLPMAHLPCGLCEARLEIQCELRREEKGREEQSHLPILFNVYRAVIVIYCRLGPGALVSALVEIGSTHLRIAFLWRIFFLLSLRFMCTGQRCTGFRGWLVPHSGFGCILNSWCCRRGCGCGLCGLLIITGEISVSAWSKARDARPTDRQRYPRRRSRRP